jgi:NAD(P)-dependent dehydrogenase (short-subunit alcohol dehydrogenase family)
MTEEQAETAPVIEDPILVTGATSGLGRALAVRLATKHVPLIIHGRNPELINGLVAELKELSGETLLESVVADLASQAEITDMVKKVQAGHKSLYAVVNNAGVVMGERLVSDDGVEITLAVNHVAPFLITQLLQDELAANEGGRVVNVNSFLHKRGSVELQDLNAEKFFRPISTYSSAKLLSLMTTMVWARKLSERNITVNAYNPGVVRTKMIGGGFVRALSPLFAKSPKTAASTAAFLATSPKVEGFTGGYYAATGARKKPSDASLDEEMQETVFAATEKLLSRPAGG